MTWRFRGTALHLLATILLVACTPSTSAGGPPPSAPPGGAVITAQGIAFDRVQLDVPADKPFPLLFENREAPLHNVTIYDEGADPLFVGEIFGAGSRTYEVPAIPSGSHRFRCDVHPEMLGTVTAR